MDSIQAQIIGEALADLLKLKKIKHGDQAGRFDLTGGAKSEVGLAHTVERVFEDHGFKIVLENEMDS